jgi:hypothetical protein
LLTRFTADGVSAAAPPQQLIQPPSNSQPSSLPPPPSAPPQLASQPLQRPSSNAIGGVAAVSVTVDSDDAAASTELLAVLSRAGLVPASCRQRLMLALLSMGIGSEKALSAAIFRDPAFLEQVSPTSMDFSFFDYFHPIYLFISSDPPLQPAFALMSAQSECVVNHVLGHQTAPASSPSMARFGSPSTRPPQHSASPQSRRSFGSPSYDLMPHVPQEDEGLVAELESLLARAVLAPPSSRRPIAAMLCAAGIGSADALAQTLERDPTYLTTQVCAV